MAYDTGAMFRIDRIVVPTDLSTGARRALDYAVDLASRNGAVLHLLHVEVLHGEILPHSQAALEDWVGDIDGRVRIETHVVRAVAAAPSILEFAEETQAGLIVMGTHGRRGVSRVLLGSVATEVVQHARCAVLTVREKEMEPEGDEPAVSAVLPPKRILVPLDFSASSRRALEAAKVIGAAFDAELLLLHVVEDRFHPAFYGPGMMSIYDVDPEIESKAKKHLETMVAETEGPEVAFTVEASPGNPTREIVAWARRAGCDLIVISTHGLTGLDHFFLGSVAERVVRLAHCPVFTTKVMARTLVAPPSPESRGS